MLTQVLLNVSEIIVIVYLEQRLLKAKICLIYKFFGLINVPVIPLFTHVTLYHIHCCRNIVT